MMLNNFCEGSTATYNNSNHVQDGTTNNGSKESTTTSAVIPNPPARSQVPAIDPIQPAKQSAAPTHFSSPAWAPYPTHHQLDSFYNGYNGCYSPGNHHQSMYSPVDQYGKSSNISKYHTGSSAARHAAALQSDYHYPSQYSSGTIHHPIPVKCTDVCCQHLTSDSSRYPLNPPPSFQFSPHHLQPSRYSDYPHTVSTSGSNKQCVFSKKSKSGSTATISGMNSGFSPVGTDYAKQGQSHHHHHHFNQQPSSRQKELKQSVVTKQMALETHCPAVYPTVMNSYWTSRGWVPPPAYHQAVPFQYKSSNQLQDVIKMPDNSGSSAVPCPPSFQSTVDHSASVLNQERKGVIINGPNSNGNSSLVNNIAISTQKNNVNECNQKPLQPSPFRPECVDLGTSFNNSSFSSTVVQSTNNISNNNSNKIPFKNVHQRLPVSSPSMQSAGGVINSCHQVINISSDKQQEMLPPEIQFNIGSGLSQNDIMTPAFPSQCISILPTPHHPIGNFTINETTVNINNNPINYSISNSSGNSEIYMPSAPPVNPPIIKNYQHNSCTSNVTSNSDGTNCAQQSSSVGNSKRSKPPDLDVRQFLVSWNDADEDNTRLSDVQNLTSNSVSTNVNSSSSSSSTGVPTRTDVAGSHNGIKDSDGSKKHLNHEECSPPIIIDNNDSSNNTATAADKWRNSLQQPVVKPSRSLTVMALPKSNISSVGGHYNPSNYSYSSSPGSDNSSAAANVLSVKPTTVETKSESLHRQHPPVLQISSFNNCDTIRNNHHIDNESSNRVLVNNNDVIHRHNHLQHHQIDKPFFSMYGNSFGNWIKPNGDDKYKSNAAQFNDAAAAAAAFYSTFPPEAPVPPAAHFCSTNKQYLPWDIPSNINDDDMNNSNVPTNARTGLRHTSISDLQKNYAEKNNVNIVEPIIPERNTSIFHHDSPQPLIVGRKEHCRPPADLTSNVPLVPVYNSTPETEQNHSESILQNSSCGYGNLTDNVSHNIEKSNNSSSHCITATVKHSIRNKISQQTSSVVMEGPQTINYKPTGGVICETSSSTNNTTGSSNILTSDSLLKNDMLQKMNNRTETDDSSDLHHSRILPIQSNITLSTEHNSGLSLVSGQSSLFENSKFVGVSCNDNIPSSANLINSASLVQVNVTADKNQETKHILDLKNKNDVFTSVISNSSFNNNDSIRRDVNYSCSDVIEPPLKVNNDSNSSPEACINNMVNDQKMISVTPSNISCSDNIERNSGSLYNTMYNSQKNSETSNIRNMTIDNSNSSGNSGGSGIVTFNPVKNSFENSSVIGHINTNNYNSDVTISRTSSRASQESNKIENILNESLSASNSEEINVSDKNVNASEIVTSGLKLKRLLNNKEWIKSGACDEVSKDGSKDENSKVGYLTNCSTEDITHIPVLHMPSLDDDDDDDDEEEDEDDEEEEDEDEEEEVENGSSIVSNILNPSKETLNNEIDNIITECCSSIRSEDITGKENQPDSINTHNFTSNNVALDLGENVSGNGTVNIDDDEDNFGTKNLFCKFPQTAIDSVNANVSSVKTVLTCSIKNTNENENVEKVSNNDVLSDKLNLSDFENSLGSCCKNVENKLELNNPQKVTYDRETDPSNLLTDISDNKDCLEKSYEHVVNYSDSTTVNNMSFSNSPSMAYFKLNKNDCCDGENNYCCKDDHFISSVECAPGSPNVEELFEDINKTTCSSIDHVNNKHIAQKCDDLLDLSLNDSDRKITVNTDMILSSSSNGNCLSPKSPINLTNVFKNINLNLRSGTKSGSSVIKSTMADDINCEFDISPCSKDKNLVMSVTKINELSSITDVSVSMENNRCIPLSDNLMNTVEREDLELPNENSVTLPIDHINKSVVNFTGSVSDEKTKSDKTSSLLDNCSSENGELLNTDSNASNIIKFDCNVPDSDKVRLAENTIFNVEEPCLDMVSNKNKGTEFTMTDSYKTEKLTDVKKLPLKEIRKSSINSDVKNCSTNDVQESININELLENEAENCVKFQENKSNQENVDQNLNEVLDNTEASLLNNRKEHQRKTESNSSNRSMISSRNLNFSDKHLLPALSDTVQIRVKEMDQQISAFNSEDCCRQTSVDEEVENNCVNTNKGSVFSTNVGNCDNNANSNVSGDCNSGIEDELISSNIIDNEGEDNSNRKGSFPYELSDVSLCEASSVDDLCCEKRNNLETPINNDECETKNLSSDSRCTSGTISKEKVLLGPETEKLCDSHCTSSTINKETVLLDPETGKSPSDSHCASSTVRKETLLLEPETAKLSSDSHSTSSIICKETVLLDPETGMLSSDSHCASSTVRKETLLLEPETAKFSSDSHSTSSIISKETVLLDPETGMLSSDSHCALSTIRKETLLLEPETENLSSDSHCTSSIISKETVLLEPETGKSPFDSHCTSNIISKEKVILGPETGTLPSDANCISSIVSKENVLLEIEDVQKHPIESNDDENSLSFKNIQLSAGAVVKRKSLSNDNDTEESELRNSDSVLCNSEVNIDINDCSHVSSSISSEVLKENQFNKFPIVESIKTAENHVKYPYNVLEKKLLDTDCSCSDSCNPFVNEENICFLNPSDSCNIHRDCNNSNSNSPVAKQKCYESKELQLLATEEDIVKSVCENSDKVLDNFNGSSSELNIPVKLQTDIKCTTEAQYEENCKIFNENVNIEENCEENEKGCENSVNRNREHSCEEKESQYEDNYKGEETGDGDGDVEEEEDQDENNEKTIDTASSVAANDFDDKDICCKSVNSEFLLINKPVLVLSESDRDSELFDCTSSEEKSSHGNLKYINTITICNAFCNNKTNINNSAIEQKNENQIDGKRSKNRCNDKTKKQKLLITKSKKTEIHISDNTTKEIDIINETKETASHSYISPSNVGTSVCNFTDDYSNNGKSSRKSSNLSSEKGKIITRDLNNMIRDTDINFSSSKIHQSYNGNEIMQKHKNLREIGVSCEKIKKIKETGVSSYKHSKILSIEENKKRNDRIYSEESLSVVSRRSKRYNKVDKNENLCTRKSETVNISKEVEKVRRANEHSNYFIIKDIEKIKNLETIERNSGVVSEDSDVKLQETKTKFTVDGSNKNVLTTSKQVQKTTSKNKDSLGNLESSNYEKSPDTALNKNILRLNEEKYNENFVKNESRGKIDNSSSTMKEKVMLESETGTLIKNESNVSCNELKPVNPTTSLKLFRINRSERKINSDVLLNELPTIKLPLSSNNNKDNSKIIEKVEKIVNCKWRQKVHLSKKVLLSLKRDCKIFLFKKQLFFGNKLKLRSRFHKLNNIFFLRDITKGKKKKKKKVLSKSVSSREINYNRCSDNPVTKSLDVFKYKKGRRKKNTKTTFNECSVEPSPQNTVSLRIKLTRINKSCDNVSKIKRSIPVYKPHYRTLDSKNRVISSEISTDQKFLFGLDNKNDILIEKFEPVTQPIVFVDVNELESSDLESNDCNITLNNNQRSKQNIVNESNITINCKLSEDIVNDVDSVVGSNTSSRSKANSVLEVTESISCNNYSKTDKVCTFKLQDVIKKIKASKKLMLRRKKCIKKSLKILNSRIKKPLLTHTNRSKLLIYRCKYPQHYNAKSNSTTLPFKSMHAKRRRCHDYNKNSNKNILDCEKFSKDSNPEILLEGNIQNSKDDLGFVEVIQTEVLESCRNCVNVDDDKKEPDNIITESNNINDNNEICDAVKPHHEDAVSEKPNEIDEHFKESIDTSLVVKETLNSFVSNILKINEENILNEVSYVGNNNSNFLHKVDSCNLPFSDLSKKDPVVTCNLKSGDCISDSGDSERCNIDSRLSPVINMVEDSNNIVIIIEELCNSDSENKYEIHIEEETIGDNTDSGNFSDSSKKDTHLMDVESEEKDNNTHQKQSVSDASIKYTSENDSGVLNNRTRKDEEESQFINDVLAKDLSVAEIEVGYDGEITENQDYRNPVGTFVSKDSDIGFGDCNCCLSDSSSIVGDKDVSNEVVEESIKESTSSHEEHLSAPCKNCSDSSCKTYHESSSSNRGNDNSPNNLEINVDSCSISVKNKPGSSCFSLSLNNTSCTSTKDVESNTNSNFCKSNELSENKLKRSKLNLILNEDSDNKHYDIVSISPTVTGKEDCCDVSSAEDKPTVKCSLPWQRIFNTIHSKRRKLAKKQNQNLFTDKGIELGPAEIELRVGGVTPDETTISNSWKVVLGNISNNNICINDNNRDCSPALKDLTTDPMISTNRSPVVKVKRLILKRDPDLTSFSEDSASCTSSLKGSSSSSEEDNLSNRNGIGQKRQLCRSNSTVSSSSITSTFSSASCRSNKSSSSGCYSTFDENKSTSSSIPKVLIKKLKQSEYKSFLKLPDELNDNSYGNKPVVKLVRNNVIDDLALKNKFSIKLCSFNGKIVNDTTAVNIINNSIDLSLNNNNNCSDIINEKLSGIMLNNSDSETVKSDSTEKCSNSINNSENINSYNSNNDYSDFSENSSRLNSSIQSANLYDENRLILKPSSPSETGSSAGSVMSLITSVCTEPLTFQNCDINNLEDKTKEDGSSNRTGNISDDKALSLNDAGSNSDDNRSLTCTEINNDSKTEISSCSHSTFTDEDKSKTDNSENDTATLMNVDVNHSDENNDISDVSSENREELNSICASNGSTKSIKKRSTQDNGSNASSDFLSPPPSKRKSAPINVSKYMFHCQRCLLVFNNKEEVISHQAEKHPTHKELHHCMLCQRSFSSLAKHTGHIQSRTHRRLELLQRCTIHAMHRYFTGRDCPRLYPMTPAELKSFHWKPNQPGCIHFYHHPSPLQLALQENPWGMKNKHNNANTSSSSASSSSSSSSSSVSSPPPSPKSMLSAASSTSSPAAISTGLLNNSSNSNYSNNHNSNEYNHNTNNSDVNNSDSSSEISRDDDDDDGDNEC